MASPRNAGEDDELGPDFDVELLVDISGDERTMDAPQDKDEEHRRIRRLRKAKHAKRRQNMEIHARNPPQCMNLNNAFVAA
jgi:hypothetical protein